MAASSVQENAGSSQVLEKVVIASDLVSTTSGGAETVNLFNVPADSIVTQVSYYLETEFDGGSITAMNVTVGDDDDPDGYILSADIATDGTPLSSKVNTGAYLDTEPLKHYDNASAKTISAVFTPTGDDNGDVDTGKIRFKARIEDMSK